MGELPKRSALVTGASSGIGRAIALALAEPGVELTLVGRDPARLGEVASAIRSRGAEGRVERVDLEDDGEVHELAQRMSHLDILVHAAGIVQLGKVESAPIAAMDAQYRVNFRAPYLLTQRCLPLLKASRGQLVFINSGAGTQARAGWSQYAATKFALRALADSLREELKGTGVRVLSVFPGRTATPMQEEVHQQEGAAYDPSRFIRASDVASMVVQSLSLSPESRVTELHLRPAE